MANLFWISAAQLYKERGLGPFTAADLLTYYNWTFARADASTCATYIDGDGVVKTAAANLLRLEWVDLDGDGVRETPGLLLEGSRINVALWNRDLTNAAWVKTGGGGVSAVKDQTGIDGVASSASRITATGANGTCLQTVTLASSQRMQTAWVKRLVGSGGIDMTTDNGSTWTAITVTTAWTRVKIPAQTVTNPILGFRIQTNADSIAVDFVQNETGAFESSSIPTTTVAVTRAADSFTLPINSGPMDLTILARFARPIWADGAGTLEANPFDIYCLADTATAALQMRCSNTSRVVQAPIRGTSGFSQPSNQNIPAGTSLSFIAQYKNLTTTPAAAFDIGAGLGAFATGATAFAAYGSQVLRVGSYTGSGFLYGVLLDLKGRQGLVTLAGMQVEPSFAPVGPFEVTDLDIPGPLISKAQSGRVNTRSTQQIGASWTEHYFVQVSDASHREFLARVKQLWRNGTIFAKGHVDYATMKGVGGGTPRVKGASQTGSTLIVDGCALNTVGWLLAGDIFRVQGLPQALQVAADVNTEGDGRALIPLVTPLFTGGSPSDNALLTITGVTLDVVLLEPPTVPSTSATSRDYGELVLKLTEAL